MGRVPTAPFEPALCRDGDQRAFVEVGVGDTGQEVGRARTERREADPGFTREPTVDVRHERLRELL